MAAGRALACAGFFACAVACAPVGCSLAFPVHGTAGDANDGGEGGAGGGEGGPGTGIDGAPSGEAGAGGYRALILDAGPVAYLRFGEAEGSVAKDERNAFAGTYPAGGVQQGEPGAIANDPDTAVTFDGTSAITMPPGLDFVGQAPFSVELWVKQTKYEEYGITLDHIDETPPRNGWLLRFGEAEFALERWSNGATNGSVQRSGAPLPLGSYHHVVATFNGELIRLFLDGQPLPTEPLQGLSSLEALGRAWSIGKQGCCAGQSFHGSLDELAIYDRALTAPEIAKHHAMGIGQGASSP